MRNRIRTHFETHKQLYAGLGMGLGLAGITMFIMKNQNLSLHGGETLSLHGGDRSGSFIFGNETVNIEQMTTNVYSGMKGHPGFLTRCLETNELFKTQSAAARAFGVSNSLMSTHLSGARNNIDGYHFERIIL